MAQASFGTPDGKANRRKSDHKEDWNQKKKVTEEEMVMDMLTSEWFKQSSEMVKKKPKPNDAARWVRRPGCFATRAQHTLICENWRGSMFLQKGESEAWWLGYGCAIVDASLLQHHWYNSLWYIREPGACFTLYFQLCGLFILMVCTDARELSEKQSWWLMMLNQFWTKWRLPNVGQKPYSDSGRTVSFNIWNYGADHEIASNGDFIIVLWPQMGKKHFSTPVERFLLLLYADRSVRCWVSEVIHTRHVNLGLQSPYCWPFLCLSVMVLSAHRTSKYWSAICLVVVFKYHWLKRWSGEAGWNMLHHHNILTASAQSSVGSKIGECQVSNSSGWTLSCENLYNYWFELLLIICLPMGIITF